MKLISFGGLFISNVSGDLWIIIILIALCSGSQPWLEGNWNQ